MVPRRSSGKSRGGCSKCTRLFYRVTKGHLAASSPADGGLSPVYAAHDVESPAGTPGPTRSSTRLPRPTAWSRRRPLRPADLCASAPASDATMHPLQRPPSVLPGRVSLTSPTAWSARTRAARTCRRPPPASPSPCSAAPGRPSPRGPARPYRAPPEPSARAPPRHPHSTPSLGRGQAPTHPPHRSGAAKPAARPLDADVSR